MAKHIPSYSILNKMAMDGSTNEAILSAVIGYLATSAVASLTPPTDANEEPETDGVQAIPAYDTGLNVSDSTRATIATINTAVTVWKDGVAECQKFANDIMAKIGGVTPFASVAATNGAWADVFGTPIAEAGTAIASAAAYATLVGELNKVTDALAEGVNATLSALGEAGLPNDITETDKAGNGTITALSGTTSAGPDADKVTADLVIATANVSNLIAALTAAAASKTFDQFVKVV